MTERRLPYTTRTVTYKHDSFKNICCDNCDAILPDDLIEIPNTVRVTFTQDELLYIRFHLTCYARSADIFDSVNKKIFLAQRKLIYDRS